MSPAVLTSPSVERVRDALSRAGLGCTIVELPGAARTAKAAAEYHGCEVGQIANSLVVRAAASRRAPRCISAGATLVVLARLAALVCEPVAQADAVFVCEQPGFALGRVSSGGHGFVHAFGERSDAESRELWAAAVHSHTVFRLT